MEEDGQEDWSREEKVAKLAQRLMSLKRRECYVKLPDMVGKYEVPFVEDYLLNPETVLEFEKAVQKNAIPQHEADQILKEAEARFLARGKDYESKGKSRPTKKRTLSSQQ